MRMPAIFVGHGSPMNAIEENRWTKSWVELGSRFHPKGIIMISAHWYVEGSYTQDEEFPQKINDMYGFPKSLYELSYPVQGSKALSALILHALGDEFRVNNEWGIDHGAWSVLVHMFPEAKIPVVQISINARKSAQEQFEVGRRIAHLRDQGYMIIGSGNVVHNLRRVNMHAKTPYPWASEFDDFIQRAIEESQFQRCIDYQELGQVSSYAVPTPDHYYPLLTVLGAVNQKDKLTVFNKGYAYASLSMTGYLFEG